MSELARHHDDLALILKEHGRDVPAVVGSVIHDVPHDVTVSGAQFGSSHPLPSTSSEH